MSRILAIDYGTRRVGIAATDPLKIVASPVTTISPDHLSDFIANYLKTETVEEIVVGYPLKEDGTPTDLTNAVDQLIPRLKSSFPEIAFHKHDERYTSKLAMQSMIQGGSSKKARRNKANLDKISATLILQSYMEKRDPVK